MNELISKLMSQANLDETAATKVLEVVKDFLEDKLPSPIDDQVSKVLSGIDSDQLGDVLGKAKGFFGK